MTDSVAQDQIRAFVERIMRLRSEAKDIKRDIREIYAEAKGNGFDKTVLGKLVSYVEKREAGAADLKEAEALFDLYLSAYDGASHTHAREDHDFTGNGAGTAEAEDEVALDAAASAGTSSHAEMSASSSSAGMEGEADRQPIQVQAQDGGGTQQGKSKAAPVASVDAEVNDGPHHAMEGANNVETAGETAPNNIVSIRKHDPAKHFLNSAGLERLHGCRRPDACAGSWRALCHGCAPRETGEVA